MFMRSPFLGNSNQCRETRQRRWVGRIRREKRRSDQRWQGINRKPSQKLRSPTGKTCDPEADVVVAVAGPDPAASARRTRIPDAGELLGMQVAVAGILRPPRCVPFRPMATPLNTLFRWHAHRPASSAPGKKQGFAPEKRVPNPLAVVARTPRRCRRTPRTGAHGAVCEAACSRCQTSTFFLHGLASRPTLSSQLTPGSGQCAARQQGGRTSSARGAGF